MEEKQEKLISDVIDMLFEAKKTIDYLPILPAKIRKSHLQVLQMVSKVHQVKGEVKVTDISKGLKITSHNITKLLNELEQINMVQKKHSSIDRRVVLIELTKHGEETLNSCVKNYHTRLLAVIEGIGYENCELAVETIQKLSIEMKKISEGYEKGE